jgi:hypothetical protein
MNGKLEKQINMIISTCIHDLEDLGLSMDEITRRIGEYLLECCEDDEDNEEWEDE